MSVIRKAYQNCKPLEILACLCACSIKLFLNKTLRYCKSELPFSNFVDNECFGKTKIVIFFYREVVNYHFKLQTRNTFLRRNKHFLKNVICRHSVLFSRTSTKMFYNKQASINENVKIHLRG